MKPCKGYNCNSIDGINHSSECQLEHLSAIHHGAGNKHIEARYRGYTKELLARGSTDEEKAAWWEGFIARVDT